MKRLIKLPEVMRMVGLSRSLLYQYIKDGKFPKQVKLGERSVAWDINLIENWIDEKISSSGVA